jgi:hypothetical protein
MTLRSWKPIRKGSLRGFACISLPNGLQVDDCPVLSTAGKHWATLPSKPVVTKDGLQARIPGSGKPQYAAMLRWSDRDTSQRFSDAVVALVRTVDPGAFDGGGEP